MTFLNTESSRTLGSPITLALFNFGESGSRSIGYTSFETDLTVGAQLYTAVPLRHDAIVARGISGRREFTVNIPNSTEVSRLFRFGPPPSPVSVTIFRGHRLDPDQEFQVVWTGRVLSARPGADLNTTLTCEWAGASLRRVGAHRNYQYSCPYALYGPQCRADRTRATVETFAALVAENIVTPVQNWVDPARYPDFDNGIIAWDTEAGRQNRTIIGVSGTGVLTLSDFADELRVGDAISVSFGCNRLAGPEGDCIRLHDNIKNFGGQPHIPTENPVLRDNF